MKRGGKGRKRQPSKRGKESGRAKPPVKGAKVVVALVVECEHQTRKQAVADGFFDGDVFVVHADFGG